MVLEIKPLAPELLNGFLDLFDTGLCHNPDWAPYYCQFYHFGEDEDFGKPDA